MRFYKHSIKLSQNLIPNLVITIIILIAKTSLNLVFLTEIFIMSKEILQNCSTFYCTKYFNTIIIKLTGPKRHSQKVFQCLSTLIHLLTVINGNGSILFNNFYYLIYGTCVDAHLHELKWGLAFYNHSAIKLNYKRSIKKLIFRCKKWGFLRESKSSQNKERIVARRVDKWIYLKSDLEVILRFKTILILIKRYYLKILLCCSLYSVLYLLKRSCALTLAHRHKARSSKRAFKLMNKLTVKYISI